MTMHQSARTGGVVRRAAVGLTAAATLTLAACGTGTTGSTAGTTTTSPTSAPSSAAATTAPTASPAMSAGMMGSAHNNADVMFAQQMIVHHQGAIEMADLAPTRAGNQQVKDLAVKIKAAQGPEIEQMTGWLQAWGSGTDMNGMPNSTNSSPSDAGGMGMNHGDGSSSADMMTTGAASAAATQMPGMMTGGQMSDLTAATGTDFDRLFLQLMITHHQGAVQMADTELAQGANPDAQALAQSIKTSQTAEIATMQQLLQTL